MIVYSAPKKSLSWVAYFSDNCCENGSEADGWRPAGGGAKFNQAQTLFGATVFFLVRCKWAKLNIDLWRRRKHPSLES